jgi:Fur family transcriptional regulator, ferric uptake regulator
VYRTLDILKDLGLVRRLHCEDGRSFYAEAGDKHGHHVLCRGCGSAAEFTGCAIQGTLSSAARQTGFAVDGHWLEVFGLCPRCRGTGRRGTKGRGRRAGRRVV